MKNIILLICLTLGIASCDSSKKPQPEPEVFLYCKIDGKDYWAKNVTDFGTPEIGSRFARGDSFLVIWGDNEDKGIAITIHDLSGKVAVNKNYVLSSSWLNSSARYEKDFSTSSFKTDSFNNGFVRIENVSDENQILSGVFSFDAYDSASSEAIQITDGRFRMNFTRE